MKIIIIFITSFLLFNSCGVKDEPKYQSQVNYNNTKYII